MSSTSCTYVTWLCKILVSVVFSRSVCIFCSALCFVYLAPEYINRHILLKAGYIEDVWVYATICLRLGVLVTFGVHSVSMHQMQRILYLEEQYIT